MNGAFLSVALSNYFFDVGNYDRPINPTYQNDFQYAFIPGFTVEKHVKVRVNQAVDYTNTWAEYNPTDHTYYSVDTVDSILQAEQSDQDLMRIIVFLDSKYTLTERQVYTFADMLGKAGGFMGAILSISRVFAYLFTSKFYSMTLLTYFYKVEKFENEDINESFEEVRDNRSEIYQDHALISEDEEAKVDPSKIITEVLQNLL
eukprot:CAMPEP_0205799862 /NCGR_PEP_ID=MMETSP0205-20121125/1323_1 /ASSEMBLY_ACC=CAM_ASM_000278 /TAXON_ID=36767 /ORGANISM="Euplotes focardii, Strain TN1" /LENGTH=202 /DNA_ID=CAMNT_0053061979 /DNA_START=484 /DNA_END=1093 /DNA_ORIENTATION=+